MKRIALIASIAMFGLVGAASAAPKYVFAPGGQATAFIAQGAIVPKGSELFFVSGIPGDAKAGDTAAQTKDSLTKLKAVVEANGYKMSDVVNVKVYLVADPATGKMDFAGMNGVFKTFFGTAENPTKPSRVTVQIAALAGPGSLVEIEMVAAK
jgi:2-iminobutanoate/2-iminopropanoate deaminase